MLFGERLAQMRKSRELTQEDLAEAIGTTARSISRWEHNQVSPQNYYLKRICQALNISLQELLDKGNEKQSRASLSPSLWYIPYTRNLYFTGREFLLRQLRERLMVKQQGTLTRPQILSGLGGIGKTQIALEYAHRFRDDYQAVLWVRAATEGMLLADFRTLAHLFQLPEVEYSDPVLLKEAVKRWFFDHSGWLLIFDDVEDFNLLQQALPETTQGHVLINTQSQITGAVGVHLEVPKLEPAEGVLFLLRRSGLLSPDEPLAGALGSLREQAEAIVALLDGLPLALDQAGSYIEETACGLSAYLERYMIRREVLLKRRGTIHQSHPASVTTTFSLAIEQIEHVSPAAVDLLQMTTVLQAEAIPQELILRAGEMLRPELTTLSADPFCLDEAIKELRRFSLVQRELESGMLLVHRLVQAVMRERMNEEVYKVWMERLMGLDSRRWCR